MAKRYLEKIAINGTEYNLLGFTSYDFLPSTATGTYIYSQSGNNFPYGISAGYNFSNDSSLFPTLSSEGISHNLDNYADTYIKKYLYDSTTPAFGVFYNSNALILAGWVNNSQENTTQCSIGIILDDENEIGWIIERVYFAPTRNVTSIACKGGNTTDGQLIYSIFGNPVVKITSNGGGATHIAKVTGQLKDLSSNLSDILMVSGGGGGGLLTGVPGWDGHEIEILTSGENRTLTAQRSNDTLTFKLFTSGSEIYSFSPAVSDLSKINLSFIADLENEVAKPSLIYDVGSDSYSYNQETPTDEEMADIFTWLDGSLPYVHVYHGYKTDNSPELYWATSQNITIDAPSRESLSVWKAYIVVIHRQTVTLPEGWTLLDTRINRSGWQYVSVYSKVVTQSETVTVSQESQNALSLMSFYTDQYNTVVYDDEYYGDSANPMNWVLPAADYPRIFAFSLGYTTEGGVTTKSVTYSPALNGWQEPNIFSSADNYRSMLFYMAGEETSNTTLTYNGFSATGEWAEDKANSSQIVAYKVIYYRV